MTLYQKLWMAIRPKVIRHYQISLENQRDVLLEDRNRLNFLASHAEGRLALDHYDFRKRIDQRRGKI